MTDTPAPQDAESPAPAPAQGQKQLLDSFIVKYMLTLMGLLSPVPVLVVILNFRLGGGDDPFDAVRRMTAGAGDVPMWLAALSLLPSLVLFCILYRSMPARVLSIMALIVAGVGAIIGCAQFLSGGPGG